MFVNRFSEQIYYLMTFVIVSWLTIVMTNNTKQNRVTDSFGIRLRKAREQDGIRQEELSEYAGIGRSYISEVEHLRFEPEEKQKIPSGDTVRKIAKRLGVTTDWLLMMPGAPPSWDIEVAPVTFSEQAEMAAKLIDDLKTEEERNACLLAVRATIDHYAKRREEDRRYLLSLFKLAERFGGDELRLALERETGVTFGASRLLADSHTEK